MITTQALQTHVNIHHNEKQIFYYIDGQDVYCTWFVCIFVQRPQVERHLNTRTHTEAIIQLLFDAVLHGCASFVVCCMPHIYFRNFDYLLRSAYVLLIYNNVTNYQTKLTKQQNSPEQRTYKVMSICRTPAPFPISPPAACCQAPLYTHSSQRGDDDVYSLMCIH